MSVSAVRARLAQQGNSSISRPRHNILAPPFSLVPPPERGGAVEIMVLKFWARRTRSRVVAGGRSCTIGLGMCMRMPALPLCQGTTRHDKTKKRCFVFVPFPNFDNVNFDQEREKPIRIRALTSPPPLVQAGSAGCQAACLVAQISCPARFDPPVAHFTICALRFASPGRNVEPISPLPTCRPRPEAPTTVMRSQASQNTAPKDRFSFIYLLAALRVPETRPPSSP